MSPTPATFTSPTKPASWSWEATSESVAARYGIPVEQVVRFDQNTAPAPPDARPGRARRRPVRGRAVRVPAVGLPPARRGCGRALRRRRRGAPRRRRRGRGARPRREGVPARGRGGDRARPDVPDVRDPDGPAPRGRRPGARGRIAKRATPSTSTRVRAAAAEPADNGALPGLVWLCSPNNPTGRAEPEGARRGPARRAWRATRTPPVGRTRRSSSTRPTSSSRARPSPRSVTTIPASSCFGR